jgi:hypothetical protein
MSESEATATFLPKIMPEEIRLVINECWVQFRREGALLHYQRLNLFRGLVSYLHAYSSPAGMLERHILCFSVQEAMQAFVNLETDASDIAFFVEPCKGEYKK